MKLPHRLRGKQRDEEVVERATDVVRPLVGVEVEVEREAVGVRRDADSYFETCGIVWLARCCARTGR